MTDVFTVLKQDHGTVQQMLSTLEAMTGQTIPEGAAREQLEALAEQLVIEESKHEAVEEQFFWPAVKDRLPGGDQLSRTAIEQEQEGKRILAQLSGMSADNVEFTSLVRRFVVAGRAHIAYEEHEVWPKLRQVLSAQEAEEIGTKLEAAKKVAPTRPHPNTPPIAGVLKTAGMAAAVTDKIRDAATGRGK